VECVAGLGKIGPLKMLKVRTFDNKGIIEYHAFFVSTDVSTSYSVKEMSGIKRPWNELRFPEQKEDDFASANTMVCENL